MSGPLPPVISDGGGAPSSRWRRRSRPTSISLLKPLGLAVHQGASHGIGAALLAGAAVAAGAALLRWPRALALGLAAFLGLVEPHRCSTC